MQDEICEICEMDKICIVKPRTTMNCKTKKGFLVGGADLVNNANTEIHLLIVNDHIWF